MIFTHYQAEKVEEDMSNIINQITKSKALFDNYLIFSLKLYLFILISLP